VFPIMFDQEFANGFTSLSPGAISPTPVKTRYGWHIIELVDVRTVEIRSFESVKKPLTDAIRKRKSRTNANAPTQGDANTAFKLYTPLAEKGSKAAQMNLGLLHFKNNSRFSNTEKAIYWFTKAGEQGHPVAQMILGEIYVLGDGVERDYFQAADWLYMAAEQGEASEGKGIKRDHVKAQMWENISFGKGVENSFRDSYDSKLSSQQKGQVKKRSQNAWPANISNVNKQRVF
jgi:hypothetical protein